MQLDITFLNGEQLTLEVDETTDQAGLFSYGGYDIVPQAKRYGYVAAKNGHALALNGEAGPGVDCYPMSAIKKLKLRES